MLLVAFSSPMSDPISGESRNSAPTVPEYIACRPSPRCGRASQTARHVLGASVSRSSTRPITPQLLGANEVPGPGDPDATGTAHLTINPGQGVVCWSIDVQNADPIFAAHIHAAPAGVAGPVVVPLNPYSGGCTTVSKELA